MTKPIHPKALFRLSVIGPLTSREALARGELKILIQELSNQRYNIPGGKRVHLSPQIIEKWYYAWKKDGMECARNRSYNFAITTEPSLRARAFCGRGNPAPI